MKMQNSEIEHNTISLKKQIAKLFDSPIRIVENLDWYRDLSILEFMNQVGRHTRVSVMFGRESVKQRLESTDGLSFNEFSYQTFQAFDFFKLFELYGCTTQARLFYCRLVVTISGVTLLLGLIWLERKLGSVSSVV